MKNFISTCLALASFVMLYTPAFSAEVCTVSMMGRVCYEEGSPELTAAHMKGDAVAEANSSKKKVEVADAAKAKK
jgi:hypothetical protein